MKNSEHLNTGYNAEPDQQKILATIINSLSEDDNVTVTKAHLVECVGYLQRQNQDLINKHNRLKDTVAGKMAELLASLQL